MTAEHRIDAQLLDLFRHQAGVIGRHQAKARGMTERQIGWHTEFRKDVGGERNFGEGS